MSLSETLNQWALQIGQGKPIDPEPANDEERRALESLKRELEASLARGEAQDLVSE